MQTHRYSFFGQKTAMILQSGDQADPWLFLTFIKKRDGGSWEKLAEGKSVKLSLPEIVALRAVVAGERPEWKTFHKNNGAGTPISARLESGKNDRGNSTIIITAGDYLRPINYPETVILEKLLGHVFEEKITHATGATKPIQEETPQAEPAGEAIQNPQFPREPVSPEGPTREPPADETGDLTPNDASLALAESLAKYHLPPLPRRLPSGVFPLTGRLQSVRTEHGITTLFLEVANGAIEAIPAMDIVGAGVHGAEIDLVIRVVPSPKQPEAPPESAPPILQSAPKQGKANKKPEAAPHAPQVGEIIAQPPDYGTIRATSVKKVTERALLVTNAGGTELWIPKSALAGDVPAPAAPQDAAWQFNVKAWFAQKADFQNWVKST